MRIAQVAPLIESVPPKAYGGTERVVSYLTEALVSQGHEVTLYASGDSVTSARLVCVLDEALRGLVHDRASEHALRDVAVRAGMTTLRNDGARWLSDGTTSLAELVRVTREA